MHLLSVYTENQQLLPKRLLRVVIFPIKWLYNHTTRALVNKAVGVWLDKDLVSQQM